ncbi:MAG: tyrosine/phenylalanine carboxypeptidase domain-containing protein [Polyangiales bacterium]
MAGSVPHGVLHRPHHTAAIAADPDRADAASELAPDPRALRALQAFEAKLALVAKSVRLLPAITARNAAQERARLEADLLGGLMPCPRFAYASPRACNANLRWLDHLRTEAAQLPAAALYLDKLEELQLDVALLASLGDARLVRPLAARRFGTGEELIETGEGPVRLIDYSLRLLTGPSLRRRERARIPADAPEGEFSLRALVEHIAQAAGLRVSVRVEPNLTAGAATGDHTVFIAQRDFGPREAWRLALHEVLGHLTAAQNGSLQPLRLLEWGTAFSFADQEGVALCIEASFGVLDRARLRSLAGRVLATRSMHAGAAFGETARMLFRDHHFSAAEAIAISERAYRGGGVARDAGYLRGFLRVRGALASGETTLDELRMGRVGLSALPELRVLRAAGLVGAPAHRPNFSRSFFSTSSGTVPWRLPPSEAASLINVELT